MAETSERAKSKRQLIEELQGLRQQVAELQQSNKLHGWAEGTSQEPEHRVEREDQDTREGAGRGVTAPTQAEAEVLKLKRELGALSSIGQALVSTLGLEETLDIITDKVTQLMGVEAASVILHDEAKGDLWFAAASGEGAGFMRSVRLRMGQGIAGWVTQQGEPVIVPDVSKDTRWFQEFDKGSGLTTRSILCVPLQTRGRTIGAIEAMNKERGTFDQEDVRLLASLAALAAAAIETARLHDQAQKEIVERRLIEGELRESEEKYRAILENIEEGYFEVDLAGNLTFFNDALCDFLGYTADEMLGKNNREYMGEESARKVYQVFNNVYRTGASAQILTWEVVRKDGATRHVESSVSLMRDVRGTPSGFRGIVRDITGQKQAQAEREQLLTTLERRSTQLQTAAEVSRAVSSILNPEALAPQVVDLVCERFGLYYAGLFLVDHTGEWTGEPRKWAVLRAGTGEAGRQMMEQGHKLEIGGTSMIGWCIANKQARIALDVGEDAIRFENPYLPETRSELALPLINRGRPIGALTIQSSQEAAFSREDITVLQTMADQLANAIANAQLYEQARREIRERRRAEEETRRRATQAALVYEVGRRVSGELELERLLSEIVTAVRDAFDYYGVMLLLVDEETNRLALQAAAGEYAGAFPQDFSLAVGEAIIGRAAATGESQISGDVGRDPHYVSTASGDAKSELAVPIRSGRKTIGVLDLQSNRFNAFDNTDALVMETLADQIAAAIENAHLYEETQQRLREQTMLFNASRRLAGASLQAEEIAEITVRQLAQLMGDVECSFSVPGPQGEEDTLRILADLSIEGGVEHWQRDELPFSLSDYPATARVMETLQPLVVQASDPHADPAELAYMQQSGVATLAIVPLALKGQAIGVIELETTEERHYTPGQLNMAMTLANQAAVALESARLYEAMQQELAERKRIEGVLQQAHEDLERYTHSLERQTAQLQVGAEVAREAVGILDVQRLLDTAVRLISDRFGFYHAGVFLVDDQGEYAVMRAASSEGGQRMLARGHRLPVGKVGIVGHVAATGEPRIALDVGEDAVHFAHADLPDTRSEMGLPLKVRARTIGVLDVQDTQEAAFSDDDVAALQTLADQLAVAIDNARLVERTETQLRELSLLHGEYSTATATELASAERSLGYVYDRIDVMPAERIPAPALDMALMHGKTVALVEPETTERTLATPLKLHDQVIGSLGIQETDGGRGWSPNEIALIEAVSEQVALALENAQHFAETQKSAHQRQVLNELAQALATNLTVEAVMEETYRGASRLLDTTNFSIGLYDSDRDEIAFYFDTSESETDRQITTIPAGQGISGYVIRNRASVLIRENVSQWLTETGVALIGELPASWMGVPMVVGGRVLGLMSVQSFTTSRAYDEHDCDLLTAIASQTAIALQNAYLFEETRAALAETRALYLVGEAISRLGDVEEIFQTLAQVLVQQLGYTGAWLALVDDRTQTLRGIAGAGVSMAEDIGLERISLDPQASNPAVQAVLRREPIVINDALADEQITDAADGVRFGVERVAEIPILVGNEAAGVLAVNRSASSPKIAERDLEVLKAVADQAAVALQNIRLLEQARRRAAQLAAASEVARDATSILEVDQLLDETVHLISEQFNFYHAGVFLLDEKGEYAVLRAGSSEGGRRMLARGHRLPVGKVGIVGYVSATGKPRIALDVGKDAMHFVNPDLPDTRSEMGLPLKVRDQVIGVLDVQSTEEAAFSDEDVATLQTLADQLAAAIVNARLFNEVRTDAMRRVLINDVQQAAVASLDPDELLHQAGEVISRRLSRCSVVFVWESKGGNLRPVAAHDEQGYDIQLPDGLWVTRRTNPTLFSDVVDGRSISILDTDTSYVGQLSITVAERMGIRTGVYIPLVARDQVLGVLAIDQPKGDSWEELDFIEIMSTNLSVALEGARLYQEAVKTAEKLQEMDRLKSQFLANMSHELRTPLNSIIGFSRVILKGIDGPLTDMQRTDLEAVYNSGQHLLELINSILDISKIQAGKMELSFEDTDLRDIIKVVMSTAIALVKDKPIELQQSIPQDLPNIRADSRRIRQVLLNLVGNAAKFTEEGFIRVEAGANPIEVIISVTDSGVGIPGNKQESIFEEFTQVDGSSTRAVGGTGLGLSISRHFVEMHGGRIWVESTVDVGSTFYIALPIAGPPERSEEVKETVKVEADPEPEPKEHTELAQKVVLCVDDDEGVITLFRRYLSKQGYRVVGFSDSMAVVEKAQQLKPFAITLDVMMPEKDGWQIIQELKANPDTQNIPVIMCTIVADKDQGISLGASDYLVKPILEDDLVAALERLDRQSKDHNKILIVDDQAEDRKLLRRMIESQEGYEVLEATGGREAIALVRNRRPNLIILDLMMPDVDGFAVLESIKADKATRSIPVVVVTAKTLSQKERDTLNKGVEALLEKGIFERQELLADVAAALDRLTTTSDRRTRTRGES